MSATIYRNDVTAAPNAATQPATRPSARTQTPVRYTVSSQAARSIAARKSPSWDRLSNESLLELSRAGYSEAAHCLIARYQYIIDNTARRLTKSAHDAADVASEIYLRVYEVLNSCRNAETLPGWIKRIAINVFNGRYRKEKRNPAISMDFLTEVAGDSWQPADEGADVLPLARLEAAERSRRIALAVASLTETHREIFDLFYTQNRSYEDIAAMTGLSLGTVKSRLFRAREALQRKLGDLVI